jgi:hypothetical protein
MQAVEICEKLFFTNIPPMLKELVPSTAYEVQKNIEVY